MTELVPLVLTSFADFLNLEPGQREGFRERGVLGGEEGIEHGFF